MKTANTSPGSLARALLLVSLFFAACKKDDDVPPPPQPSVEELYAHSITDAMVADSSERIDTLWKITPDNTSLQ